MRRTWILSIVVSLLITPLLTSSARAQANFYEGKTVNVYIGAKSGSLPSLRRSSPTTLENICPASRL